MRWLSYTGWVLLGVLAASGCAGTADSGPTTTPPTCPTSASITATPADGVYTAPLTVTLATAAAATVRYTLDGSTPDAATPGAASPITVTLTESTTLHVTATDACGNETTTTAVYTLDATAPTSHASVTAKSFTDTFTLDLVADEAATLYYTLDGTTPSVTSPNGASPLTVTILAGGDVTLSFFAVDAAGNTEAAVHMEIYLYATPPSVTEQFPADAQATVRTFANLRLRFSNPMAHASVLAALSVTPVAGNAVPLSVRWYSDAPGEVLVAWPAPASGPAQVNTPWQDATSYNVVLAATATDVAGTALASALAFTFTTLTNSEAEVVTISPDPNALAPAAPAQIAITFDRAMDPTSGLIEMSANPFGDAWTTHTLGAGLGWSAGDATLTLSAVPPLGDFALVRVRNLRAANGDGARDLLFPITANRSGGADSTAPLLDSPAWTSGDAPVALDRRTPILWFSETLDPATIAGALHVVIKGDTAPIDVQPHLAFAGRSIRVDLSNLSPGVTYALSVLGTLKDAAGNFMVGTDIEFELPASYDAAAPSFISFATARAAIPFAQPEVWLDTGVALDAAALGPTSVELAVAATGEPVRGLRLAPSTAFLPSSYVQVVTPPGTPSLAPLTGYSLSVVGLQCAGVDLPVGGAASAAWTTTGADASGGMLDYAPMLVASETGVALGVVDSGLELNGHAVVLDDGAGVTVELDFGGSFVVALTEDVAAPGHYVVADADIAIADPGFALGWNNVELVVDDGTHVVSETYPVYRMAISEIPTLTSPATGAVLAAAAIPALSFDWSSTATAGSHQVVALGEVTGAGQGGMAILDYALLDSDAVTFAGGTRFADKLAVGKNYVVMVMKEVMGKGTDKAGEARWNGKNLVFFSIQDPSKGSIAGSVLTRAAIGAPPMILLFDQDPGQNVNPILMATPARSAFAVPGGYAERYDYAFVNLTDNTRYYVMAYVDVLGDGFGGPDDLMAWYDASGPTPIPIDVTGLSNPKDQTGIDISVDNWAASVLATVQSTGAQAGAIAGELQLVLCDTAAVSPPFDQSLCHTAASTQMAGAAAATLTASYVVAGSYDVWAVFDVGGDGTLDRGLATLGAPAPVVVSSSQATATIDVVIPSGELHGQLTNAPAGGRAFVYVYAGSGAPGGAAPEYAAVEAQRVGATSTFTYSVPFLGDGGYSAYAMFWLSGPPGPPNASATQNPATFTVTSGDSSAQDFAFP